ncbi:MAG: SMP-30/gluconolactonase/LRE family protein [Anaerolineae bacterium]|nr:SMP-30/gluconolactonase/LRE family protein [Anaerolineae bacterium]
MNKLEHVLAVRNELGEGPLWHPEEQALYWVDIPRHNFHRLIPATGRHEVIAVGLPIGVLAFRAAGGLVMATRDGFALWDFNKQVLEFITDPEADRPQARFNDGAVDRQGRFWAGTMSEGFTNSLYRLDPDGSVHKMETGIGVSNGLGWSPDDKTMYFTDSPARAIYAYDFDSATGNIKNRRIFVQVPEDEGLPDGLAVDRDGFIWSAHWDGWKITRYSPAGQVERVIQMPVQRPTSCAFGGPNLDELYITSARPDLAEAELKNQPLAGDIFRLKVEVPGLSEAKFLG